MTQKHPNKNSTAKSFWTSSNGIPSTRRRRNDLIQSSHNVQKPARVKAQIFCSNSYIMPNPVSPPFTGRGLKSQQANNEAESWPRLKSPVDIAESHKAAVKTTGREDWKPAVPDRWQIDICASVSSYCRRCPAAMKRAKHSLHAELACTTTDAAR